MALGLLPLIGIQIGLNLLARLLAPKQKRPKPQAFEAPTAESGGPMKKGFGIYESQPTVVLVKARAPSTQTGDDDQQWTEYKAKMVLFCGHGPIHRLYDIISDERSIRTQQPGPLQSIDGGDPAVIWPALPTSFSTDTAVEFSINARQMYGGRLEGGGLQGLLKFYPGNDGQPIDPLVAEIDGDFASAYPRGVYARLGAESSRAVGLSTDDPVGNQQGDWFYLTANTPAPRPLSLLLGYYARALLEEEITGYYGNIGLDGNAIEQIFDLYTNPVWGARKDVSLFNLPNWRQVAQRIASEGLGTSIPEDSARSVDDTVEDLLSHIDGGIVVNPQTGLLEVKLARGDYTPSALLVIDKSNSDNFKRGKPLPPRTLNDVQVRYRRFIGGVSGEVAEELVTEEIKPKAVDSGPPYHLPVGGAGSFNAIITVGGVRVTAYAYKSEGDHIIEGSVHAYSQRGANPPVELTLDTEFVVDFDNGLWWFVEGTNVQVGDRLTISYATDPAFVSFVDDVAVSQNLANVQGVGRQQPESYDYPFYTQPLAAQWKADRLRTTLSRSLDTFSWEGFRDQSHLTPWDVVVIQEDEWGMSDPVVVRITKVSGGTRTEPRLLFEGVKDIWGESLILTNVSVGGTPGTVRPTAPSMAIACGIGGADTVRIALFGNAAFTIRLWVADDEFGTNRALVDDLPGDTPYYDTTTLGKFYQAQLVRTGSTDGSLTPYITCAPVDEPPVDPTCVLPTWSQVIDPSSRVLTLTITDPDHRVQEVRYRTKSGSAAWSSWQTTTAPYVFSVSLVEDTAAIEWQVDYLDCGGVTLTDGDSATFGGTGPSYLTAVSEPTLPGHRVTLPEPTLPGIVLIDDPTNHEFRIGLDPYELPPTGIQSLWEDVALQTGRGSAFFANVGEEYDVMTELLVPTRRYNLSAAALVRVASTPLTSTLPSGAVIGIKYVHPTLGLRWLDGVGGPTMPVGQGTFGTGYDRIDHGLAVEPEADAQDDVRLIGVIGNGDGTGFMELSEFALQVLTQPENLPESPDPEDPPEQIPQGEGGCNDTDLLQHLEKVVAWHIADCGSFNTTGGGSDTVNYLNDLSGNGNVLGGGPISGFWVTWGEDTGEIPFLTPIGRKAAVFSAAWLQWPSGAFSAITDGSLVIAIRARFDPAAASNYIGSWNIGSAQEGIYSGYPQPPSLAGGGAGNIHENFGTTSRKNLGVSGLDLDEWHVYAVRSAAGVFKVWLDGSLIFSTASNTVGWRSLPIFGARGTNSDFAAGEIIVGSDATESEIMDWVAKVGSRHSISVGGGGSGAGGSPGGGGQNNGGGPSGQDPNPPGTPVSGTRYSGCSDLAVDSDHGPWNGTIKPLTPDSISILDLAIADGMYLGILPCGPTGPNSSLYRNFSIGEWKRLVSRIAGYSEVEDFLNQQGNFLYLLDEPKLASRWGTSISNSTMQEMALFARSIWPNARSYFRIAPSQVGQHINGLTGLWYTYKEGRGGTAAQYFAREAALAAQYNHTAIGSINCTNYTRSDGWISVAQYREASQALCAVPTDGFNVWDYRASGWYSQSGMPAAVTESLELYHSLDPP